LANFDSRHERPLHRHVVIYHRKRASHLLAGPRERLPLPGARDRPGRGTFPPREHLRPPDPSLPDRQPGQDRRGQGRSRDHGPERQPPRVRGGLLQHQHRGEPPERLQRLADNRGGSRSRRQRRVLLPVGGQQRRLHSRC
jgi:hypothetical protein